MMDFLRSFWLKFELLFPTVFKTLDTHYYPLHWPYILSCLLIAGGVFFWSAPRRNNQRRDGFWSFIFPSAIYRHQSAILDYKFFVVNQFVYIALFAPLVMNAQFVSGKFQGILYHSFGPSSFAIAPTFLSKAVLTIAIFLVADFGFFVGHWVQHKFDLLWKFHEPHHSAEVLTPITYFRSHPIELFILGSFTGFFTGLVYGYFDYISSERLEMLTIFNLNMFSALFNMAGANFRHSHIWISYPRFLSHIFISPAQHQIHHSKDPRHANKNFGSVLAIWDWMIGSLYIPRHKEELHFGIPGHARAEFRSVSSMYLRPFKNAMRATLGKGHRGQKR